MVGHTKDSWTLEWDAPFSDGIWIDSHEIQIVRLPDTYLPGASVTSSHEFDKSTLSHQLKVYEGNFMSDAIEGPWTVIGHHYPGHTVANMPPWTAYRCRVRVNTIVGWSDFSKAVVVHTAGMTATVLLL